MYLAPSPFLDAFNSVGMIVNFVMHHVSMLLSLLGFKLIPAAEHPGNDHIGSGDFDRYF